jgi:hypothetical protein
LIEFSHQPIEGGTTMNAILQIVAVATADLSDSELVDMNQIVQIHGDPRRTTGYLKLRDLFTQGGGTRLHPATQQALAALTLDRLTRP